MVEFKKASENLSRTQQVSQLNDNDSILDGKIAQQEFLYNEVSHLYTLLNATSRYTYALPLGNTASTYTSWTHVQSENGYSIWSYPVSVFEDGSSNLLMMDSVKFTNKRQADSLAATSFNKVLCYFNGYKIDNTTEAGTSDGVAFSFLQDIDGVTTCMYLGLSSQFKAIDFNMETSGGTIALKQSYWNGSAWNVWDGACTLSKFVDNTDNLHYSGRTEYDLPSDWATSMIDGSTYYWMKLMTNTAPSQIPYAYSIRPGNSVPSLLSLSALQIVDRDLTWCYFNSNIYCTIPNSGDGYYEGNLFIKSSSSVEAKQNYFINNHLFALSYAKSNYTPSTITISMLKLTTAQRDALTPVEGDMIYNLDNHCPEYFDNIVWKSWI